MLKQNKCVIYRPTEVMPMVREMEKQKLFNWAYLRLILYIQNDTGGSDD